MIIGVAIRNLVPFAGIRCDDRASDLISGVCLSLFLVMTMMALNLIEVALSAGPFLVIIAAQVGRDRRSTRSSSASASWAATTKRR